MNKVHEQVTFRHFSHHHPLVLANSPPKGAQNTSCSGCSLKILPDFDHYQCKTCPFYLHQTCYSMPRKALHSGHENHSLTLFVMPSSAKDAFTCKACGDFVTGFYYNCTDCGLCFHTLCTVLPLSVAITSHPHTLRLEFSPPYDFECDICKKPSYKGWSYRCQICEFDTHLACAISNQRTQSPRNLFTEEPDQLAIEGNELVQKLAQRVLSSGVRDSTEQEHNQTTNGQIQLSESVQRNSGEARMDLNQDGKSQRLDPSGLVSGELSVNTSYQFSDAYFSIDLAKSYSNKDDKKQWSDDRFNHDDQKAVIKVEEAIGNNNDGFVPQRIRGNFKEAEQKPKLAYNPVFDMHYTAQENRSNEVLAVGYGTESGETFSLKNKKKIVNGLRGRSGIKDHSPKSYRARLSKFLVCCYDPRYERSATIQKNRNM